MSRRTKSFLKTRQNSFVLIVMAILGCQLDCIWDELQSRNGGHTCDPNLEAGRQLAFDLDVEAGRHRILIQIVRRVDTLLIQTLRQEDTHLTCRVPPSAGSLLKASGRREGLFFTCLPLPCQLIHPFTGTGARLFRTPAHTEDQRRHPASWD